MNFKCLARLFILIWASGSVLCEKESEIALVMPSDNTPSCYYTRDWIRCSYLQEENIDMLQQVLRDASEILPKFGVELDYCDGPSIPADIFLGYHVEYLNLNDCGFPSIPYDLLSNINYQLTYLYIDSTNFTSVVAPAPPQELPFAGSLTHLMMEVNNIQKFDVNFLQQYINLQNLYFSYNNLRSIDLELLGIDNLNFVYYDNNEISTIASGAFSDLRDLQYLDLSDNNLTNLQEEAFLGLDTSPILFMELYGNPWNCTCDLQWLKDWLNDRNLTESSGAECAYPTEGNFNDIEFC